jgi:branched-chain amino acid transport system substrate-binding protein
MYELGIWEVKKPAESRYAWDYYKRLGTIAADQAFLPVNREACSFLRK